MEESKEIIFVVARDYIELGRSLSGELAKQENFKSICFEVKDFLNQNITQSQNRFFISIGDASENPLSKEILSTISDYKKDAGQCIATKKSYAAVFGEAEFSCKKAIKDSWNFFSKKAKEKILHQETQESEEDASYKKIKAQNTDAALAKFFSEIFIGWISEE